ncbi:ArsR family transcriptional regulator [Mycetocola manganoxydans]|uniref:ArsR family transcriptional regulator n=1 Tax=Mycetocola manganoxydans TaxID=699879 RepID=A0A3L6ZRU4_9MICO|nr:metalloregulator ArsR/SmtB family transcription factor [Mycetocola manganoxydans]RLP70311.1 ArsR family transcriptional regulator [Mycetocola manganoxydans]
MASPAREFDTAGASSAPAGSLGRDEAETLARTLRAVADPTRLQVLSIISHSPDGEITVGDLAQHLGLRQPTVSHHLRIMVGDGLLARDQRGRNAWYSIVESRRADIADLIR